MVRRPLPVERAVERALQFLLVAVDAVRLQRFRRQGFRPGDELAVKGAPCAAFADAMLLGRDLAVVPDLVELAQDAAVPRPVAIPVGRAFPHADGYEVRRLQGCDQPLVDRVIGDPVDPDLAVAPGLVRRPLDAVVEILDLPFRQQVELARAAPGAASIDPDAGIAVRDPLLGIDVFPGLEGGCGPLLDLRIRGDHAVPAPLVALLERKAFPVGAGGDDRRVAPVLFRQEDVGAQDHAVVHPDRRVPDDAHAQSVLHMAWLVGLNHFMSPRRRERLEIGRSAFQA